MNTSTPLTELSPSNDAAPEDSFNDSGPVVSYVATGLALIYMLLV